VKISEQKIKKKMCIKLVWFLCWYQPREGSKLDVENGKCLPQDEKSLTKTSISSGVNKYVFSLGQLVLPDLFGNIFHNLRQWGAREYGHP